MLLRSKLAGALAALLALAVLPAAPAATAQTGGPNAGLTSSAVTFTDNGVTLHGTVLAPPGGSTPRPGMVLMGGSDWTTRGQLAAEATAFAQHGLVVLSYDKRTAGYSTTQRDYSTLADDALAAIAVLRARPDVDPNRVGLFGISEGGWVAPLAATRSATVAFVVTVGASGMNGAQQSAWFWGNLLRHEGVQGSLLRTFPVTATRLIVGAGLFPEANYDPVATLRQVHQPVLALWGEEDINHPAAESATIFAQALDAGGNRDHTIRFLRDAGPDLHLTRDGGWDKLPQLAPGYPELVSSWVGRLGAGATGVDVQRPAPHQDRLTTPLAPLAWYESVPVQLTALALLVVIFLGYLVGGAIRRTRPTIARRAARWLAGSGALAVVGFVGFLGFLSMTGAQRLGPILFGRPLPWLVLQLLAVTAVVSGIVAGTQWWRAKRGEPQPRLAVLLAGGVLFVPWALYWGLLVP